MADIRLELPSYSENAHFGWEGNRDLPDISQHRRQSPNYKPENDPSLPSPLYWFMHQQWGPIQAVLGGTAGLRRMEHYLPQLPNEPANAYARRCQRGVLSPYLQRIIKAAVGLILRKPIQLTGGTESWWQEWRTDVNRQGSGLEEFCSTVLFDAIAYGHNGWLVDHWQDPGVRTLADQLANPSRPYFVRYETPNIIGWREGTEGHAGSLQQLRLREIVTEEWGSFGQEQHHQVRVLEPGKWGTYRPHKVGDTVEWREHETGNTGLGEVPFTTVFSQREGLMHSSPPLAEIAQLNLQHYSLQAQLLHSLHVAAQPMLVIKGWNSTDDNLNVGVNNAISLPVEGDCFYVEPASEAFAALHQELDALQGQMAGLGVAILARQKNVAESGISKQLDRADTNSMLSVISKDLEASLQQAVNWVGQFAGVEPPTVVIDRDYNADPIDAQLINSYQQLYATGAIDQRTLLELLRRGEVFGDDFDPEAIIEAADQELAFDVPEPPAVQEEVQTVIDEAAAAVD